MRCDLLSFSYYADSTPYMKAEAQRLAAEKARRDQEAKAKQSAKQQAVQTVNKAKKSSTISLFNFGGGSEESATPAPAPAPKPQQKKQAKKAPPKGVPSLSVWKINGDGSISGRISGSPNFREGQIVTTSPIAQGRVESGSVVKTGSGSQYYLS